MFVYTSLFGAYSSYLFLRPGTVAGPLAAHIFCNAMGLPDFAGVRLPAAASSPAATSPASPASRGLLGAASRPPLVAACSGPRRARWAWLTAR